MIHIYKSVYWKKKEIFWRKRIMRKGGRERIQKEENKIQAKKAGKYKKHWKEESIKKEKMDEKQRNQVG